MRLSTRDGPVSLEVLEAYSSISIAFSVESRFRVDAPAAGLEGFRLVHEPIELPYTKNYDADADEHPSRWAMRWDVSRWRVFSTEDDGRRVGGAVVAFDTEDVWFLEGRRDVAALWDIRVAPEARGQGVGTALFKAAADWAQHQGCRLLKIETQNVNVPACRFYAEMGCELGQVNRFAYLGQYGTAHPDEVQLVWYLHLDSWGARR